MNKKVMRPLTEAEMQVNFGGSNIVLPIASDLLYPHRLQACSFNVVIPKFG